LRVAALRALRVRCGDHTLLTAPALSRRLLSLTSLGSVVMMVRMGVYNRGWRGVRIVERDGVMVQVGEEMERRPSSSRNAINSLYQYNITLVGLKVVNRK
jgi:hypothetical protein